MKMVLDCLEFVTTVRTLEIFLVSYALPEVALLGITHVSEVSSVIILNQFFVLDNTGLFEMIIAVLTTCHTQHTSDSYMCFLYNRTTIQVFVTYLTGALYVHPL